MSQMSEQHAREPFLAPPLRQRDSVSATLSTAAEPTEDGAGAKQDSHA